MNDGKVYFFNKKRKQMLFLPDKNLYHNSTTSVSETNKLNKRNQYIYLTFKILHQRHKID